MRWGLAFTVVLVVGLGTSLVLLRLYRPSGEAAIDGGSSTGPWSLAPEDIRLPRWLVLALVSVLGLFLELLMIRWVSSEIRVFAYFKNFVLIAAFLGFGLGFQLSRRRVQPTALLFPLVVITGVITIPWSPLRELIDRLPAFLGSFSEVHIWGVPSLSVDGPTVAAFAAAVFVSVALFSLVTMMFVPIGQLIGWGIETSSKGIRAYTVNLLGSLGGILLFTGLATLRQPPWVWLATAGVIAVALFWRRRQLRVAVALSFVACLALVGLAQRGSEAVYWSPYQKLAIAPVIEDGELLSYRLTTNNSWYQQIVDLSDSFLAARPDLLGDVPPRFSSYNLPYRFMDDVESSLILGSGMGNDVAAALRNDSARVTAVEIDPVILDLGRRLHFEHPYEDPRVEVVVDDARAYIQNTDDRFDLIVFALLDSHTTASHFSNIRIDNYVYTVEALEAARDLLGPDGVMVVKFQVDTPWIGGRLQRLLTDVFGHPPLSVSIEKSYSTSASFFIAGSEDTISRAIQNEDLSAFLERSPTPPIEPAISTTDDWPFFYQQAPGLPFVVLVLSALLVFVTVGALQRVGIHVRSFNAHFFFLGAGFLLLEVHIVSKMALLFGTTWVVNSLVVAAVLLLAVGANLLVEWAGSVPSIVGWGGLFASMFLSFVLPLDWLFFESVALRVGAAALILCLPVFFAGIVFIRSFAAIGFRGEALGWNLIGSLVGGVLESLSLWTGLKAMVLVATLLYGGALFTQRRATDRPSSRVLLRSVPRDETI